MLQMSNAVRGYDDKRCAIGQHSHTYRGAWPKGNVKRFSWLKRKVPHCWWTSGKPETLPYSGGIKVIGSPWVLKEAKQRGMILAVRPILEELLAIGYWLHPERVIHPFLQEIGELPPIAEPSQE